MSDIIAKFQSRYLLAGQTTTIGTEVTFDASADGIKTGDTLLLAKNDIHINPNLNLIDNLKATGQALQKTNELVLGNNKPDTTIQVDFNAYNASLILRSLLQNGVTEAVGSPFVKTATQYTDPGATFWLSLVEVNKTSDNAQNNAGHGGIVTQLTLRSDEESQVLDAEAGINFASYDDGYDASSATIDDPQTAELAFKDMTALLGGDGINIPSFEIVIANKAQTRFFHDTSAVKHVLGNLEITGNIVIPRDAGHANWDKNQMVTNLLAKTDAALTLYWGATPAASEADLSIIVNMLNINVEKITEVELGWSVPFKCVDDETNNLSITWSDAIDRGI